MKLIKTIFKIFVSFFISFLIFYNVTSSVISYFFQGSFKFEQILYVLVYLGQSILFYLWSQLLFKETISKQLIQFMWCLYACVMVVLLFGRPYLGASVNLNLLKLIDMNLYSFFQNMFNFLFFIPIGFVFKRNNSKKRVLIISLIFVVLLETLQLVFMRGVFDIVDILCNVSGIFAGFIVSPYVPETVKIEMI